MSLLNLRSPFAAGHFEMALDGGIPTSYVRSVDGGLMKANVMTESIGGDNRQIKHSSSVEIEPITAEIGLSGARDVCRWISDSWAKKPSRRSGHIGHADFDKNTRFDHAFTDALILETSFPALDALSKDPGYLKVKFHPEKVVSTRVPPTKTFGITTGQQKMWLTSSFALELHGMPLRVSKIDGFTIKQGVKALYSGRDRLPELVPTKIEFPDLTCTMALDYSDAVHAWYTKSVQKGGKDTNLQTAGALVFLRPDRKEALFRIDLHDVGIKSFTIEKSDAASDQIKRCKFELYVGHMELGKIAAGMS